MKTPMVKCCKAGPECTKDCQHKRLHKPKLETKGGESCRSWDYCMSSAVKGCVKVRCVRVKPKKTKPKKPTQMQELKHAAWEALGYIRANPPCSRCEIREVCNYDCQDREFWKETKSVICTALHIDYR